MCKKIGLITLDLISDLYKYLPIYFRFVMFVVKQLKVLFITIYFVKQKKENHIHLQKKNYLGKKKN